MNRERLLKMADFLEGLPTALFDLNQWLRACGAPEWDKMAKLEECGTTACVVGWMPRIFPNELSYKKDGLCETFTGDTIAHAPCDLINEFEDRDDDGWEDVQDFLGIREDQFEFLFLPTSYPQNQRGPRDAAARLRWIVDNSERAFSLDELANMKKLIPS